MILVHDGLLGMKHGHRRWRNYDGTLTEEGKKRYDYYQNKTDRVYRTGKEKQSGPKTYIKGGKWGQLKEDLSNYSNDELKALTYRAKLEKEYRDAFNTYQYTKGKQFIENLKNTAQELGDIMSKGAYVMKAFNDIKAQAKYSSDIERGKYNEKYKNKAKKVKDNGGKPHQAPKIK